MSFVAKVGTFAKTTSAATASQAVTGVGFPPKALILFTGRETATGLGTDGHFFIGITDGTTSKSYGYAGGVTGLSQAGKESGKTKALTMNEYDGTGISECDLTSFDSDGFTLSWTTNDASARIIGYLALGGSSLSAKVIQWTTKTTSGSQSTTGVGFQPTTLFTIGAGGTTLPPFVSTHQELFLGCVSSGDGTWSSYTLSLDNTGLVNCLHNHNTSVVERVGGATLTSFDADGWTLNYATGAGFAIPRATLALAGSGIAFKTNTFTKTTSAAPVTQTVSFTGGGSVDLTWNPNDTGTGGPIFYWAVPGSFTLLSGTLESADTTTDQSNHVTEFGVSDGTTSFFVATQQLTGNSSSAHPLSYTGNNPFGDRLSVGGSPAPQDLVTSAVQTSTTARPKIDGHLGVSLLTEGALVG